MTPTADLRYPIGRFEWHARWTPAARRAALQELADVPAKVRGAVIGLDDGRLDTPYRPGGWTVRQVVHHLADSHVNGYIRLKLALTEDNPLITPYDQDGWARLADSSLAIAASLAMLDAVTERLTPLLDALGNRELTRRYTHSAHGPLTVETHLHFYAWHARHHTAHVTALRQREGW